MTKEITQEKIYNLTDKQVREEHLKQTISAIENTLGILSTKQTIEDLKAENERLKKQLDREIHINRIMKKALEVYADEDNWSNSCVKHLADSEYNEIEYEDSEYQIEFTGRYGYDYDEEDGYSLAQQVLKEIDNKE